MKKEKKPYVGNVLKNPKYQEQATVDGAKIVGAYNAAVESAAKNDRINRFHARQGHGYAAEQANHLIDVFHGKDAKILGDNNAKNGADRMVDGQLIQSKYCQNAKTTINAVFENNGHGNYKYLDGNGNPMQVEVPSDQYAEAVELMRKRIIEGKVPGVTNPDDAEKIVRKGNIDYKTACNIAKAGNIDSLTFDAANGAIIATYAFGISAVITFAKALWSGKDVEQAVDNALCNGIQCGGVAFVASVAAAQLTRTSANRALIPLTNETVKLLPSNIRNLMVNAMRNGAPIYGAAATRNLSKLMRSNIITQAVVLAVMSAGDVRNFFQGKISGKQLLKTVMTGVGGMGAAGIGALAGSVVPGLGNTAGAIIGGFIGGLAGTSASKAVLDQFIEDDAVQLVKIIEDRFVPLVHEYLLDEEEVHLVVDDLQQILGQGVLLDMYAAENKEAFADDLLRKTIEKTTSFRTRIILPSTAYFTERLNAVLAEDYTPRNTTLPKDKSMGQVMAAKLLDRDVSKHAADKAWYVTKKWNLSSRQQESVAEHMLKEEEKFVETQQNLNQLSTTLDELIDGKSTKN